MTTTFNESDHPRDDGGKFAAKDAPESEASLGVPGDDVPSSWEAAEALSEYDDSTDDLLSLSASDAWGEDVEDVNRVLLERNEDGTFTATVDRDAWPAFAEAIEAGVPDFDYGSDPHGAVSDWVVSHGQVLDRCTPSDFQSAGGSFADDPDNASFSVVGPDVSSALRTAKSRTLLENRGLQRSIDEAVRVAALDDAADDYLRRHGPVQEES